MMAEQGKTVICAIHQPSTEIFMMFHKQGLFPFEKAQSLFPGSRPRRLLRARPRPVPLLRLLR